MNDVMIMPRGFTVQGARARGGSLRVQRPDGLTIFLSDKPEERALNRIRLTRTPVEVAQAVGLFRGAQIARGYLKKYAGPVVKEVIE